jgi:hypothetical protein
VTQPVSRPPEEMATLRAIDGQFQRIAQAGQLVRFGTQPQTAADHQRRVVPTARGLRPPWPQG